MKGLHFRHRSTPAWRKWRPWVMATVFLVVAVLAIRHFGEIEHWLELMRTAQPKWLLLAIVVQCATYVSAASVWFVALRRAGHRCSLFSLVGLAVAKLFSDQALPSGGMSGNALVIAVLHHRGVPARVCMGVLQLSLISYHAAYMVAAIAAVLVLGTHRTLPHWISAVAAVFYVFIVAVPAVALWARKAGRGVHHLAKRMPGLARLLDAYAKAPGDLLRDSRLVLTTSLLQGSIFLFDSTTLWIMLRAVGEHAPFGSAFGSFMLASMVATLGPIPAGIGTFEATCVATLGMMGIPFERALTATLLLRGFTLWLPMLPGMWLARKELHRA